MDWTGVQVTLWQLGREKSLIAKRSEMKGNSGNNDFGSAFVSSNPPTPASQCGLSYGISACVRTADIARRMVHAGSGTYSRPPLETGEDLSADHDLTDLVLR
jgi:hypothetical protein